MRDVLERLIRRSQNYKTNLSHAINTNNTKFDLLPLINGVDYDQIHSDFHASFDISLSYTWLDWRIMDMLKKGVVNIEDVDEEQQLQLVFNILPEGRSFLHMLAEAREDDENDQIKAFKTSKGLFDIAAKNVDLKITGADDGCTFEVPLLPDIFGRTALD